LLLLCLQWCLPAGPQRLHHDLCISILQKLIKAGTDQTAKHCVMRHARTLPQVGSGSM
jgi:hypothetical protein